MRVLVIGGTEFISLHLVQALRRDGHDVTVLNRGRRPARLPGGVRAIVADRKDHAALRAARPASASTAWSTSPTRPRWARTWRRCSTPCRGRSRPVRVHRPRVRSRAADPLRRGHPAHPLLGRLREAQDRRRGRAAGATPHAGAAGDHRAAHPRLRAAQHAQQRDVLLRPSGATAPSWCPARAAGCGSSATWPTWPTPWPHAGRAGIRTLLQRQRRGSHHPGRLRRADRRGDEAPPHADFTPRRWAGRRFRSGRTSCTTATPSTPPRACARSWE